MKLKKILKETFIDSYIAHIRILKNTLTKGHLCKCEMGLPKIESTYESQALPKIKIDKTKNL